ncbi:3'(2'),5'-bisphosphate nucleotidase CysQ [Vreelandella rituensis]|uniref:3'(2'),5'-bisphosphate nucleotidase CysQ n=1 Tax=Vreelandella rituensis TaxID=2282306 RepID=A0A368TQ67_9GAMM|nr:3'(2'),5'-bisphosphate nucleotidase CysQ [Halomonas rituensis]RCV86879.1 3'(2'),5'-bisphosphate nucleotidase [Halomonas rituensis]
MLALDKLMAEVASIAQRAGDAIMAVYARDDFGIQNKADDSPLTEADLAAHELIVAGLQKLPERFPILSEEDTSHFSGPDASGRYWLVDPLDGTKEFIKRNGEFTVNIALIEHGEPILGVVVAPALKTCYLGARNLGAFKAESNAKPQPIQVAGKPKQGEPWRVVSSRSHPSDALAKWLEALGPHELVSMGSSLKLCLLAEGAADVYPRFGPTCLWDTAAAHAVLQAAGGRVETFDGQSLDYADPKDILNPYFLAQGH